MPFHGSMPRRMLPWFLLVIALLAVAALTPLLLHRETPVNIRVTHTDTLPDGFYLYQQLTAQGIRIKSITPADNALIINLEDEEQSAAAQKLLQQLLPGSTIAA